MPVEWKWGEGKCHQKEIFSFAGIDFGSRNFRLIHHPFSHLHFISEEKRTKSFNADTTTEPTLFIVRAINQSSNWWMKYISNRSTHYYLYNWLLRCDFPFFPVRSMKEAFIKLCIVCPFLSHILFYSCAFHFVFSLQFHQIVQLSTRQSDGRRPKMWKRTTKEVTFCSFAKWQAVSCVFFCWILFKIYTRDQTRLGVWIHLLPAQTCCLYPFCALYSHSNQSFFSSNVKTIFDRILCTFERSWWTRLLNEWSGQELKWFEISIDSLFHWMRTMPHIHISVLCTQQRSGCCLN